jgi:hypothetical protein
MVGGFLGALSADAFIRTLITLYLIKVAYEIAALPFSTRLSNWVKKVEGIDTIDSPDRTSYNPFMVRSEL